MHMRDKDEDTEQKTESFFRQRTPQDDYILLQWSDSLLEVSGARREGHT